jgi:hypothetical protein
VGHGTESCQFMNDWASGLDNSAATSEVLPSRTASKSCCPRYPCVYKHVCVYPHQSVHICVHIASVSISHYMHTCTCKYMCADNNNVLTHACSHLYVCLFTEGLLVSRHLAVLTPLFRLLHCTSRRWRDE